MPCRSQTLSGLEYTGQGEPTFRGVSIPCLGEGFLLYLRDYAQGPLLEVLEGEIRRREGLCWRERFRPRRKAQYEAMVTGTIEDLREVANRIGGARRTEETT
jgi:hypothetical protein